MARWSGSFLVLRAVASAAAPAATSQAVELGHDATMSFKPRGADGVEISLSVPGTTWLGLGFSMGDRLSMTGAGEGADVFLCNASGVHRHWVRSREVEEGVAVPEASCVRERGRTTMVFSRKLAAEAAMQRAVTPGSPQQVVWAYGLDWAAMEKKRKPWAVLNHMQRRGGILLDFASGDFQQLATKGDLRLCAHFCLMTAAFGVLLPMAFAIVAFMRDVSAEGAWFQAYRACHVTGSALMLTGLAAALWFVQERGLHMFGAHSIVGAVACVCAAMAALTLPFGTKVAATGRTINAIYGVGSFVGGAMALVNMVLGLVFLFQRAYEASVKYLALGLVLLLVPPVLCSISYTCLRPNNRISRWLTSAKQ